jgi:hypothetical protein
MAFNEELAALLEVVAARVDRWTGHDAWVYEPGSPASIEVADTSQKRADGSPWGDRPIQTAYAYAQMATKFTVEMTRCVVPLVRSGRPSPGVESLTRTSLEAGSVAWWLLKEGLTVRQRVCRLQLLRRNSARELAKSIKEVGEDPRTVGGETVAGLEAECRDLGLPKFGKPKSGKKGDELDGEIRRTYTSRVKDFTDDLGCQGAYSIYSGVAHAELGGIWRLFGPDPALVTLAGREPLHLAGCSPRATHAAANYVLKSMMGPMERIALLFGWSSAMADQYGDTVDLINRELARLEP